MKKSILFLGAFVALTMVSCKKDHTCSCTTTSTAPGSTGSTVEIKVTEAKKADVKRMCTKTTSTQGGFTTTQDCQLK